MLLLILRNKKGQVAPFLVLLIGILLLAIAATMLIGEAAFTKIRMANVTDGALLTASSSYCRSLNQIRQIKGSLEVNNWFLWAFLWGHTTNCCGAAGLVGWRYKGEPLATGTYINTMLTNKQLMDVAKKTAKEAVKDLRSSLYDGIFGAGLADEPKPFLESEVYRDTNGRVTGFNFNAYLNRDPRLTVVMRKFKADHPYDDNADTWYKNNSLIYYFSKSKDKILPLLKENGEPQDVTGYTFYAQGEPTVFPGADPNALDAYQSVALKGLPESISVDGVLWPLVYLWWKPIPNPVSGCHCIPLPGIIPNPYASLRMSVNPAPGEGDGFHFEVDVAKSAPYKVIFFERQVKTGHKSNVRISGGMTSGFENKME